MASFTKNAEEAFRAVEANLDRLEACPGHEFTLDRTPERWIAKTWECRHCMGTVDSVAKVWYERGLQHGQARARPGDGSVHFAGN